jgi:predicted GNAT family acetyltransferase
VSRERVDPRHTERIQAFLRTVEDRSATRIVPFRWGRALFHDDLPRRWDLNFLRVEGDAPDADALMAEAERLHSQASHRHRKVSVASEALAERVQEGFKRAGWDVERLVVMAHRRSPDREIDASFVREVDFDTARPVLEELYRRDPLTDDEETVSQLVRSRLVTARVTRLRHFAVVVDGAIASICDLYSDGSTAQIEDVNTLEEFRGRGYARATISRALEAARAEGCDLVFLVADDDDWPKALYHRIGFDALFRSYGFLRPG